MFLRYAARWALLACFVFALVRTAWLCDDAFITLRTVAHLLDGYGPRWNVAERVQTYTHPLWMLLLTGVNALSGEPYYSTLALAALCSIGAVVVTAWAGVRDAGTACLTLLCLTLSRAFVDFSTSGLENPLTHLLLAVFVWLWFAQGEGEGDAVARRQLLRLSLLGALMAVNRLDTILLVGPCLVVTALQLPWRVALRVGALGMTPLAAWLLFAFVYYGTPIPITAYAKTLSTGIAMTDAVAKGLRALARTGQDLPLTTAVLGVGLFVTTLAGPRRRAPLLLGAALYLGYFLKVGGDFMLGRMLTAPLLIVVTLLGRRGWPAAPELRGPLVVVLIAMAGLGPRPATLLSGPDYGDMRLDEDGFADERGSHYPQLGLLSPSRDLYQAGVVTDAMRREGDGQPLVMVIRAAGAAYLGGPLLHAVDVWICDPLLARLPAPNVRQWRVGHIERRIPEGYLETLRSGANELQHPGLAAYYDNLREVLRGDLFSAARWQAIWRLHTGALDDGLRAFVADVYRDPPLVTLDGERLVAPQPEAAHWFEGRSTLVYGGGVRLEYPEPLHAARLQWGLDSWDVYWIEFWRGNLSYGTVRVETPSNALRGLGLCIGELDVPAAAVHGGYDAIEVRAMSSGDATAAVGFLRPVP